MTIDLDSVSPNTIEKTPNMTYLRQILQVDNLTSIIGVKWLKLTSNYLESSKYRHDWNQKPKKPIRRHLICHTFKSFHLTSILASNIEVIQSKLTSNDLLFSQWPKISIQQPQKPLNRHPAWPIFAKYYKLTVWPPSKRSNDWNWPPQWPRIFKI